MGSHGGNASDLGSLPGGRKASQGEVSLSRFSADKDVHIRSGHETPQVMSLSGMVYKCSVGGNGSDCPDTK